MSYDDIVDNIFGPSAEAIRRDMFKRPVEKSAADRIREAAQRTIEKAERDIARAEAKLAAIEKFGADTYPETTILVFKKRFSSSGMEYTYAALKCNEKWYLTGPRQSGLVYDWDALISFVVGNNANADIEVYKANTWKRIV